MPEPYPFHLSNFSNLSIFNLLDIVGFLGFGLIGVRNFNKTNIMRVTRKKEKLLAELRSHYTEIQSQFENANREVDSYKTKTTDLRDLIDEYEIDLKFSVKDVERDVNQIIGLMEKTIDISVSSKDIIYDLKEMIKCLRINSTRAVLALAGRVLEQSLKIFLLNRKVLIPEKAMVGELIKLVAKHGYVDPSLDKIWKIINEQRVIGVHDKTNTPIPSRAQCLMVSYATIDLISRTFNIKYSLCNTLQ